MARLTAFITSKLKLKVNQQKSAVARHWERKFLGFSFTSGPEPRRRIAPKALIRFKKRVRELTKRTRGISIEEMARQRGRHLRGWHGDFGAGQICPCRKELDQWIRRRLRSFLWKQWKRGPARYTERT